MQTPPCFIVLSIFHPNIPMLRYLCRTGNSYKAPKMQPHCAQAQNDEGVLS